MTSRTPSGVSVQNIPRVARHLSDREGLGPPRRSDQGLPRTTTIDSKTIEPRHGLPRQEGAVTTVDASRGLVGPFVRGVDSGKAMTPLDREHQSRGVWASAAPDSAPRLLPMDPLRAPIRDSLRSRRGLASKPQRTAAPLFRLGHQVDPAHLWGTDANSIRTPRAGLPPPSSLKSAECGCTTSTLRDQSPKPNGIGDSHCGCAKPPSIPTVVSPQHGLGRPRIETTGLSLDTTIPPPRMLGRRFVDEGSGLNIASRGTTGLGKAINELIGLAGGMTGTICPSGDLPQINDYAGLNYGGMGTRGLSVTSRLEGTPTRSL